MHVVGKLPSTLLSFDQSLMTAFQHGVAAEDGAGADSARAHAETQQTTLR